LPISQSTRFCQKLLGAIELEKVAVQFVLHTVYARIRGDGAELRATE